MTKLTAAPSARVGWLPYLVAATFFMEYLDTTIVATALPQMAHDFGVGPNELSLGMSAYMLTLAVFIPISGWMADRFGSRTIYASAIVVFTLASVLCGISASATQFTGARILQGLGGAMMVPVGRLIVVRATDKSQLMQAIATITWPAIAAPVFGPSLGGFITTFASWHWVFLINVPIGLAALALTFVLVPNQHGGTPRPLDMVGFVLSGIALTSLLYGTELASHHESNIYVALGFMLLGVVFGVIAWRHAHGHPHPLLDFTTLRVPTYSITVINASLARIGNEAVPYLLPLMFQIAFNLSAFQSGLLMLASALGNFGMKALVNPILRRYGFRSVVIASAATGGIATMACALLMPQTPLPLMLAVLVAYGMSRSMQFSTLATLAYADIGDAQKSAASTLWSVAQQLTIGMGIAFGALALRGSNFARGGNASVTEPFSMGDFHWALVIAGAMILCSLPGYATLARDAGAGIGGGSRARS